MSRVKLVALASAALAFACGASVAKAAPPPGGFGLGSPVDAQNVEWLDHVPTPTGVAGLAFIPYSGPHGGDVLFADGPFGLRAYSLADPAHPRLVGDLPAANLPLLPGDDASKGFWEGEHLQTDPTRKLVFLSRDPRAFGGTIHTGRSGIYVVDARDPRHLRVVAFAEFPAGHTTACIDHCHFLWTGGPFDSGSGSHPADWNGEPVFVTDVRDPFQPSTFPTPVDLNRNDGQTAYVHSTDVDAAGVVWTSGLGGVRGYWTNGVHFDPVAGRSRLAHPWDPVPYAGGGIVDPQDPNGEFGHFDHNSWHPTRAFGSFAPGELLFVTDEDFGSTCATSGELLVASLKGSFGGESWRSTPANPFRLQVVGTWSPAGKPGEQTNAEDDCSAHWFVPMTGVGNGNIIVQSFYGQGIRFLDITDPTHPNQVGYFVPIGSETAAPAFRHGLVYDAQYSQGIDVVRFTPPGS
jgi:hypothetical protein